MLKNDYDNKSYYNSENKHKLISKEKEIYDKSNFNRLLGLKNKKINTWFYRPRQIKKHQKQFD